MQRLAPSHRSLRAAGALALTAVLAAGATGCGGSDGGSSASGGGAGDARPAGKAPAANEAAIREALRRGPAATKAAGTARIALDQTSVVGGTKSSGTIDLAEQRILLVQGAGDEKISNYAEKGKAYIQTPIVSGWRIVDAPAAAVDPLAQVRRLERAKIVRVGGTKEYGGKTCREFDAEVSTKEYAAALGAADGALGRSTTGVSIPITSCIDDSGLTYATASSFDIEKTFGEKLPDTSDTPSIKPNRRIETKALVTEYGTAPAPQRPDGIDDAKPIDAD